MPKPNDGGPTHPCERKELVTTCDAVPAPADVKYSGMSLRDHFAGLAMYGLLCGSEYDPSYGDCAIWAYAHADAMPKEREKLTND